MPAVEGKSDSAFVSPSKVMQTGGMDLMLAGSVMPIDLIVFDCDGVLLDSMPAKIESFRQWVPEHYADQRAAFMEAVMGGFGRARTHHIRNFYEIILGQAISDAFLIDEVARFAEICEPLCASAPWRAGSKEFVQTCRDAGIPLYVLSGTPQQPLDEMLESTGGTALFDVIIGSPPAKPESLTRILSETSTPAQRTVFVGDANADQEAAIHVGAHFVYFPSEANPPLAETPTVVGDLRELLVQKG